MSLTEPLVNSSTLPEPEPEQIQAPRPFVPPVRANFYKGLGLTALLGGVAMLIAPLPGLAVMGNLTVALLLGIAWRSVAGLPRPYTGGIQFSARKLLRYGIILTGVRLNFNLIVSSGLQVLLLDLILIVLGLIIIPRLGKKLGISSGLAFLIAMGQSICGASAIGAVATITPDTDEDDISLAVALCGVVGTAGVLFFSLAGPALGWPARLYGLLSGSTLQEIAQVVAAGNAGGPVAADLSLVVKLTRVMLLAPVVLVVAAIFTSRTGKGESKAASFSWKKIPVPWFIFGFLAVGAVTSSGVLSKDLVNITLQASIFLMVMAMAAMGLMVDLVVIRKRGLKALTLAGLAFAGFIATSFLLTIVFGI